MPHRLSPPGGLFAALLLISGLHPAAARAADTTPPTTPTVRARGTLVRPSSPLRVSWKSRDAESGIRAYQYQLRQDAPDGRVLVPWTAHGRRRALRRRDLALEPGTPYVVEVQAQNGAGLWSDIGASPEIRVRDTASRTPPSATTQPQRDTTDTSPPSAPGKPTEGSSTTDADYDGDGRYRVYWPAASDAQSQIAAYELQEQIGSSSTWKTLSSAITSPSFAVRGRVHNTRYAYHVRAKNKAKLWGAWSATSDGLLVDTTNPGAVTVRDDGTTTTSTTSLQATWTSSSDSESGVVDYQYLIRQDRPSGKLLVTYTSVGLATQLTKTGLTLTIGTTYYLGVRAKNGAGRLSPTSYSDGITVVRDTTAPIISALKTTTLTPTTATLTWTTSEPATSQVEYGLTTAYGAKTPLEASLVTAHTVTVTGLSPNTSYHARARSKDAAGNERISSDLPFTTAPPDTTPPSGSVRIDDGATYTTSPTVTLTLAATDNSGTVSQMQLSNDGSTYSTPEPYATTTPWTLTSGDGTKTVWVKVQDVAGNWSSSASDSITLDATAPTGTVTINRGAAYTTSPAVTLSFSSVTDDRGRVTQMQVSNDGSTYSAPEAYASTKSWTLPSGDGAKTVSVKLKDEAGNWSSPLTDTITLDATPPTIAAVTVSPLTATTATLAWTTDEPATSTVDYGSTESYGRSTSWSSSLLTSATVSLSGLSELTLYHYRLRARDGAGNEALSPDATFTTLDATAPSGAVTINGGATYTTSPTVTLTLAATDNSGTVSQMQLSNDGSTYSTPEPYATTTPWTLTSGDGYKYVYVKFADPSGNWSSSRGDNISLDTRPPTGSVRINDGASITTSPSVTLTLSARDAAGTVSQMQCSNDHQTYSSPEPYATTKPWELAAGDGLKTVWVKFANTPGNWSAPVSDPITLDTTPPTGALLINDGAAFTATTEVTLRPSATDATGRVTQMQLSNDGQTYTDPESYSTSKRRTLPSGDGPKTVSIKYKDDAGHWSNPVSATITLDTVPPTGELHIEGDAAVTNLETVTLTLVASDATGRVTHMRFSNDGRSYSSEKSYATTTSWRLTSGLGPKTVYAQFRDAAGNWSSAVSDAIVRGTTPTISSIQPADRSEAYVGAPVTVSATATDNEQDPLESQLLLDGQVLADWAAGTSRPWIPTEAQQGPRRLEIRVRDGLGGFASKQVQVYVLRNLVSP